mmetsp:Transcript_20680/g.43243  ORF Transcript_20680/g.43243 Transcript_20680/m.43243 type:complete len:242 (+) Transcript_20680:532-1257(+)
MNQKKLIDAMKATRRWSGTTEKETLCAGNQMVQYFHKRSLSLTSTRYLSRPSCRIASAEAAISSKGDNEADASSSAEAGEDAPYTHALMKYAGGSHTRGAATRLSKKTFSTVMARVFSFPKMKGKTWVYSMWDMSPTKIPPYKTYARFLRASQSMLFLRLWLPLAGEAAMCCWCGWSLWWWCCCSVDRDEEAACRDSASRSICSSLYWLFSSIWGFTWAMVSATDALTPHVSTADWSGKFW